MLSEKAVLTEISKDPHPFIVNLLSTFQDEQFIYIVLEYVMGGEFFTHLRNAGNFDSWTASFYAAHVVHIFDCMHAKNIIYRDLKPEVSKCI
jgi:serine/threonine protein kinase